MGDLEGGNGLPYVTANDRGFRDALDEYYKRPIFDTAFPILVIRQGIWAAPAP